MPTLAAFLLAITSSIVKRALTAIGFAILSYATISTIMGYLTSAITTSYTGMSTTILSLLNLAGAGQALGIMIAAFSARAALMSIKKLRIQ